MKQALTIILIIIFGIGIYMNFGMGQKAGDASITGGPSSASEEPSEEVSEEPSEALTNEAAEASIDDGESVSFNQEALDEIYKEAAAANEPVIIDVIVPSYYTEDFVNILSKQFGTSPIEFNRIDMETASTELEALTVNANSDAVIMGALQIGDYNQELLPDRETDRLEHAYMNLYDAGKVVYLLGDPNAHQDENLAQVLKREAEYFQQNDYYYVDNQALTVEEAYYDYDAKTLMAPVEVRIAQNIHEYMVE